MPKPKPTLNPADINLLKGIFATKDDVENIVEKKIKPMRKDIKQIKKDINLVIGHFDDQLVNHNKRLGRIENHLDLPSLP